MHILVLFFSKGSEFDAKRTGVFDFRRNWLSENAHLVFKYHKELYIAVFLFFG